MPQRDAHGERDRSDRDDRRSSWRPLQRRLHLHYRSSSSRSPLPLATTHTMRGYTKPHAKRHQGILSRAPQPDRGPGPRTVQDGRQGPRLHRYHPDLRRAGRARRVEEEVLREHVSHCVEHAIASGDRANQRQKITELMGVIGWADR